MDDTNNTKFCAGELGQPQTSTSNLPNDTHAIQLDRIMENKLAEAAARQNWQLSPIYRLPNETFGHVFELAYFTSFEEDSLGGERGSAMALVQSVSLVSKRWRGIVLSNPRLWSIIDIPNQPAVETCITRSKGVPLLISLVFGDILEFDDSPEYAAYKECVPALATCINRCQILSHNYTRMVNLELLFADPAPNLEALHLDAQFGPECEDGDTIVRIPDGFFHEKLPRLRRLRLLQCHLPLNPSNYANLIDLGLSMITFIHSVFPLFGVLIACPSLELLRLHYVNFTALLNEAESLALAKITPIAMPRLQGLSIVYADRRECMQFILGSIHPPRSLHLNIVGDTEPLNDLCSMLPLHKNLGRTLQSLLDIEALAFAFRLESFHETSEPIDAWHIQAVSQGGLPDRPPCPLLTLRLFPPSTEQQELDGLGLEKRMFQNLGRDLHLPQLKTLKITHLDPEIMSAAVFAGVLDRLPSITLLEFVSCSPVFVQTLAFTSDGHLCPSLETLQLQHSSIIGEDLLAVIESRAQATDDVQHTSLRRLALGDCCAIGQSTILKLGGLVEVFALS
ncbi:hypothetical protein BOTBODRAFT_29711 [Botryobasidium botryosum FD-172 SS1]|uniref:Uncharacterized protein n=1 Tax=Botryobasidium botryosum (strain FD-172 SS1) TaxID=930990 RepID=A0A067N173_BOTB1|nr:hypothetical protein BOTBODRAFT_29711 [Botryobasidium botryosum FD-172 SS1]